MHLKKVKRYHILESGLQKVYTHVIEKDIYAVSSPLDRLLKADSWRIVITLHLDKQYVFSTLLLLNREGDEDLIF